MNTLSASPIFPRHFQYDASRDTTMCAFVGFYAVWSQSSALVCVAGRRTTVACVSRQSLSEQSRSIFHSFRGRVNYTRLASDKVNTGR